jgi:hypothetical protein
MGNVFKFVKIRSIEKSTKPVEDNYIVHLFENRRLKIDDIGIEKSLYYALKNMEVRENNPLKSAKLICNLPSFQNYSYSTLYNQPHMAFLENVVMYFRANRNQEIIKAVKYITENIWFKLVEKEKKQVKVAFTVHEIRFLLVQIWDRLIYEVAINKDPYHRDETMALIRGLSIFEKVATIKVEKESNFIVNDFLSRELLLPAFINPIFQIPWIHKDDNRTPYEEPGVISEPSDSQKETICHQPDTGECNEYINLPLPNTRGKVRDIGWGDLLVVKKELIGYELGEIAAIRNVMKGEKYESTTRFLTREELTTFTSSETEKEESKELETNNRFELEKEADSVISEDSSLEAGISVTAKFGTVKSSATANYATNTSREESNREAQNIAQEITSKAVSKLILKTKEERKKTIFTEREDTSMHILQGSPDTNNVGVYYFLDKIYRSRVFNYGERLMLQFEIPEPSTQFLYFKSKENLNKIKGLVEPTHPLNIVDIKRGLTSLKSFDEITKDNYFSYAAFYDLEDAPVYPDEEVTITQSFSFYDAGEFDTKGLWSSATKTYKIPEGYYCDIVNIHGQSKVNTFNRGFIEKGYFIHDEANDSLRAGYEYSGGFSVIFDEDFDSHNAGGYLDINKTGKNYTGDVSISYKTTIPVLFSITFKCKLLPSTITNWKKSVYETIINKYNLKLDEFNSQKEQKNFGQIEFGDNPNMNRIIEAEELKKACISLITNQKYESFDAMQDGKGPNGYPEFNHEEARREGSYIQFFEQMIEWKQMTYWFWDYFWGRKRNWIERKLFQTSDPMFKKFIESGSARVILPVRRGYEKALMYYLETGRQWEGNDIPVLNNPKFVSIVDQIKESEDQTEAKPIGIPWEVKLATNLVIMPTTKKGDTIPDCVLVDQHTDLPCLRVSRDFVIDKDNKYYAEVEPKLILDTSTKDPEDKILIYKGTESSNIIENIYGANDIRVDAKNIKP